VDPDRRLTLRRGRGDERPSSGRILEARVDSEMVAWSSARAVVSAAVSVRRYVGSSASREAPGAWVSWLTDAGRSHERVGRVRGYAFAKPWGCDGSRGCCRRRGGHEGEASLAEIGVDESTLTT